MKKARAIGIALAMLALGSAASAAVFDLVGHPLETTGNRTPPSATWAHLTRISLLPPQTLGVRVARSGLDDSDGDDLPVSVPEAGSDSSGRPGTTLLAGQGISPAGFLDQPLTPAIDLPGGLVGLIVAWGGGVSDLGDDCGLTFAGQACLFIGSPDLGVSGDNPFTTCPGADMANPSGVGGGGAWTSSSMSLPASVEDAPEPAGLAVMGVGLLGLLRSRRRLPSQPA